MKRGSKYYVKHSDGTYTQVTILGPEDFDGYAYNRPGSNWQLIRYPDGSQVWKGEQWLKG